MDREFIENIRRRLSEVEARLSDPGIAADRSAFQQAMSEHARLKKIVELGDRCLRLHSEREDAAALLNDSDQDMRAMAREEHDRLSNALPEAEKLLRRALLPPRPEDNRNTIVEIRAGTGGDEAAIFAGNLFRMYNQYGEAQGWKIETLDATPANVGGYKEVVFSVEGRDVYRMLRYESGVHRVQRVPVTEASGRIHTSAATVAVLPEAEEVEVKLEPAELRIDIFRSSGPGGQSVNTTDSAVRITHQPTGIVVQCQDEKSQHRNKDKAMRVLRARLLDRLKSEDQARTADERRSQIGSGDRSERIRTYNFPQNRVTDHRINLTLHNLDRVMEGELDELINALTEQDVEKRLNRAMAGERGDDAQR